jgi:predicted nucleic acid-binding protein
MKAYLDNNIVCGRVRSDLAEENEMTAVRNIERAWTNGQLEICTSPESWREQDRTKDENLRLELERDRPNVPVVSDDHRLLGIRAQFDQRGSFFANCPILTEVVDDALLATFKRAGLKDADARHLMYAVHNGCDRFVTTDPHFLDRRPALEGSCRGLRIVKPSELETELPATDQAR